VSDGGVSDGGVSDGGVSDGGVSDGGVSEQPDHLPRLDPDMAIRAHEEADRVRIRPGEPVIDTRKYQWMIGGFGLFLLLIFSVYMWAHNGAGTPGVAAGQPLHRFVAPLASSDLDATANTHPRCDPAHPARRGLNVCGRRPIVLTLFALGAKPCVREVDTLQRLAASFPAVQFAAVAINADRRATAALRRRHHWTIPVAYDQTGVIGELYGMSVCPILELARAGGVVEQRLIGEHWEQPAALAAAVRKLTA
jgi:thiol-disulfide isomerase/thioredoxin